MRDKAALLIVPAVAALALPLLRRDDMLQERVFLLPPAHETVDEEAREAAPVPQVVDDEHPAPALKQVMADFSFVVSYGSTVSG